MKSDAFFINEIRPIVDLGWRHFLGSTMLSTKEFTNVILGMELETFNMKQGTLGNIAKRRFGN